MNDEFGKWFYWKAKYEEKADEIEAYWKPLLEQRQAIIDQYLQFFKEREYLSEVPTKNRRR